MNQKETFVEFVQRDFAKSYCKDKKYFETDFKFHLVNLTNGKIVELAEEFGNQRERQGYDKGRKLRDLKFEE